MRYLKNVILKGITAINGFSFLLFASCADTDSWIPFIMCCVNVTWFTLFGYANGWSGEEVEISGRRKTF